MVGKLAFLFPGQGSQSVGMGKVAFEKSLAVKDLFDNAERILGFSLTNVMFHGPEDKLKETAVTQPALFLASAGALELLREKGIKAAYAAGHSLGEYSALYASGAINFENALILVRERGRLMSEASAVQSGTMAAVIGLEASKLEEVCRQVAQDGLVCAPANYNSDSQIVISGSVAAVNKAMQMAQAAGAAKVVQLNVSGAFHSKLMSQAAQKMGTMLERVPMKNAQFPVITNVDAQPTSEATAFKQKLVRQIDNPVCWHESMKKLLELGVDAFIEVGSGRVLSTIIKKLDRQKTVLCTDDFESIEKTLPALAAG